MFSVTAALASSDPPLITSVLLTSPNALMFPTDSVPADSVTLCPAPPKVFAPNSESKPVPAFVIPKSPPLSPIAPPTVSALPLTVIVWAVVNVTALLPRFNVPEPI